MPERSAVFPSLMTWDDHETPNAFRRRIAQNYITCLIGYGHAHRQCAEHRFEQLLALPERALGAFALRDIFDDRRGADGFATFIPLRRERNTASQKVAVF